MTIPNQSTPGRAFAFSPEGRDLYLAERDGVWQHFLSVKHKPPRLICPTDDPLRIAVHPGGHLLAISENRLLRVCDVAMGAERWRRRFSAKPQHQFLEVWDIAFSPDGAWLAAVADDSLYLFAAATGQLMWQRTHRWMDKHSVAWGPDTTWLAAGDYDIRLWHAPGAVWPPTGHAAPRKMRAPYAYGVASLAFTPDGALLASAGEGPLILWAASDGHEIRRLSEDEASFDAIACNALGTLLACAGQTALRLYDLATGMERYRSDGRVQQVAFHPQGHVLAILQETVTLLALPKTWTAPES